VFFDDLGDSKFLVAWGFTNLANPVFQVLIDQLCALPVLGERAIVCHRRVAFWGNEAGGLELSLRATLLGDWSHSILLFVHVCLFVPLLDYVECEERIDFLHSGLSANALLNDISDLLRLDFGLIIRAHFAFILIILKHFECLPQLLLVKVDICASIPFAFRL